VFVLVFVVEVVVGYNLFMHKTQPQKLIFFFFYDFFSEFHTQLQPPSQIQTHTKTYLDKRFRELRGNYYYH